MRTLPYASSFVVALLTLTGGLGACGGSPPPQPAVAAAASGGTLDLVGPARAAYGGARAFAGTEILLLNRGPEEVTVAAVASADGSWSPQAGLPVALSAGEAVPLLVPESAAAGRAHLAVTTSRGVQTLDLLVSDRMSLGKPVRLDDGTPAISTPEVRLVVPTVLGALDRAVILDEIARNGDGFAACATAFAGRRGGLPGVVAGKVTVASSGTPEKVELHATRPDDPELAACTTERLMSLRFAPIEGGAKVIFSMVMDVGPEPVVAH